MSCSELFQEAKELEKEGWGDDYESQSHQVTTVPSVDDLVKWKDKTRAELVKLVIELKNSLKEELKGCSVDNQGISAGTAHSKSRPSSL